MPALWAPRPALALVFRFAFKAGSYEGILDPRFATGWALLRDALHPGLHPGAACPASRWAVSRSASRASRRAAPRSACPFRGGLRPRTAWAPLRDGLLVASCHSVSGRVAWAPGAQRRVLEFPINFVTKVQEASADSEFVGSKHPKQHRTPPQTLENSTKTF